MEINIGELRKLIADHPDEMKIVVQSSNFELRGAMVKATATIQSMITRKQTFRDAFDGSSYSKEVYEHDFSEQGEKVLLIRD